MPIRAAIAVLAITLFPVRQFGKNGSKVVFLKIISSHKTGDQMCVLPCEHRKKKHRKRGASRMREAKHCVTLHLSVYRLVIWFCGT